MHSFENTITNDPAVLVFSSPVDGLVYSWCPTMDLIAFTANNGKNLWVHRKNGYRVWDIQMKEGMVKSLAWKPDGKQISVITTKNQCHIYDSNSARLLSTVDQLKESVDLVQWIMPQINDNNKNYKFTELVDTDVLKSLPKLPPLPHNANSNTFSTKLAIEGMIQQSNKTNELDFLLSFSDKKLDITLHDLFSTGPIDLISLVNDDDEEIVSYISQDIQSHFFITSSFSTMKLYLRHFKFSFASDLNFLQDITASSSKIIALNGYINEILMFLAQEIRTYLDFNKRFVDILREELEKIDETVGDQLYDLLLTGMMSDELKDWLENTIGERGVARWTKIGDTAYDNTRRTIFYHLVPSCERLIILLNNIKGAVSVSFSGDEGFDLNLIDSCLTSVQNLMKLFFQCIIKTNKEQGLFNSFVAWLSFVLRELKDETPNTIYQTSDVSDFINSHLEKSSLMMFIPNMRRHYNEVKIGTSDLFDSLKSFIRKSIIPSDQKFELGIVTEKQKLIFDDKNLYIISNHNINLDIYKFDTISNQLESAGVIMDEEIFDLQVSEVNDEVYLITGGELISFQLHQLFSQSKNEFLKIELKLSKSQNFETLKPKHLAINSHRNIGCLISDDLKRCMMCSLDSKFNDDLHMGITDVMDAKAKVG